MIKENIPSFLNPNNEKNDFKNKKIVNGKVLFEPNEISIKYRTKENLILNSACFLIFDELGIYIFY
jgi:hypothetical protein